MVDYLIVRKVFIMIKDVKVIKEKDNWKLVKVETEETTYNGFLVKIFTRGEISVPVIQYPKNEKGYPVYKFAKEFEDAIFDALNI